MKHTLLIIGGGAAGLIAAITAKDFGIDVAIIEANDRIGKKLLTTGNGRCNITNESIDSLFDSNLNHHISNNCCKARYHSNNEDFYKNILESFPVKNTVDFFFSLGLPLTTLEDGKMYPLSLQASSVLDIFKMSLEDRAIPLYMKHKVINVVPSKKGFKVLCRTEEGEDIHTCEKLMLCAGSKSAPNTGSDGSGYNIAKALGHKVIPTVPALVQLKLDYKNLKALAGIKFDGEVSISVNGIMKRSEFGEILFTDYGISGPPILQLSRIASYGVYNKQAVSIKVDMLPNIKAEEMEVFLENHWAMFSHRSISDAFIGIINKKSIPILLKEACIDNIHKPCYELQWKEKKMLYKLLKSWEFKVTDTNSFSNSQVTAGGIDTLEVNEVTLESKLVPNLYFAGEILDVDGDCGGYNLQWAWSSGYTAAKACTK